jgi:hypothetical protein
MGQGHTWVFVPPDLSVGLANPSEKTQPHLGRAWPDQRGDSAVAPPLCQAQRFWDGMPEGSDDENLVEDERYACTGAGILLALPASPGEDIC